MDKKIKHLEFIQAIISRMNSNSFIIKGWTITLVSAILAFATATESKYFILTTFIPLTVFWILDSYFLSKEKQYRSLYNRTTKISESKIDFLLKVSEEDQKKGKWKSCLLAQVIFWFYFPMVILLLLVIIINTQIIL